MTPAARFNELLQDIEPSATTKSNASTAHTVLRNFLREHSVYKNIHVHTILSGSYKRDTAIRPQVKDGKSDRPDVDIIVITSHTLSDSPRDVLTLLYDVLAQKYADIRKQNRSIGLSTNLSDMDVVPAIQPLGEGTPLYIPDRKQEQWILTNPGYHTQWTIDVNGLHSGRFKPIVKMLKWWRRENKTISKQPKGFVIEVLAAKNMNSDETHYGELFVQTLENFVSNYRLDFTLNNVPVIADPAVPGNNIMEDMSYDAFKSFYNCVEKHAEIGRKALKEDDQEKATALWREIFGQRFPVTKNNNPGSLLGAAVSPSLSFPNQPVEPRGPKGFA